jgi:hypothetical protein
MVQEMEGATEGRSQGDGGRSEGKTRTRVDEEGAMYCTEGFHVASPPHYTYQIPASLPKRKLIIIKHKTICNYNHINLKIYFPKITPLPLY